MKAILIPILKSLLVKASTQFLIELMEEGLSILKPRNDNSVGEAELERLKAIKKDMLSRKNLRK